MPQTMPEQIDELIQSIRENYDTGPTLREVIDILVKVRYSPNQLPNRSHKEIEEYFLKK